MDRTAGHQGANALLVSELFPPAIGGSAVLFENVYSRLREIPVTVLTHTDPTEAAAPHSALPIVRKHLQSRRWGLLHPHALAYQVRLAAAIRRLADARQCVVHCGRALPEGLSAFLSKLAAGAPYLCWAHGEDIATALSSRELTLLMKRVYRGAAATFANSRNTAELLTDLGVPAARIRVVYPGVDTDRFNPHSDGTAIRSRLGSGVRFVMLSVGRLQRRKGHDLALAALHRLKTSHPGLRYIIVGDGDERQRLEVMIRELGLGHMVTMTGEVPDVELPQYYAAADLFVLPNRTDGADIEGFGIVFLEAAASGLAVIGGRSGGVPEALEDGATGMLVSGTDAEELAGTIDRLAASPAWLESLGRAGRARAVRDFTWDRAAALVASVHLEVGSWGGRS